MSQGTHQHATHARLVGNVGYVDEEREAHYRPGLRAEVRMPVRRPRTLEVELVRVDPKLQDARRGVREHGRDVHFFFLVPPERDREARRLPLDPESVERTYVLGPYRGKRRPRVAVLVLPLEPVVLPVVVDEPTAVGTMALVKPRRPTQDETGDVGENGRRVGYECLRRGLPHAEVAHHREPELCGRTPIDVERRQRTRELLEGDRGDLHRAEDGVLVM